MKWYKKSTLIRMEVGEVWEDVDGQIMYIKGDPTNSPMTYWQLIEVLKASPTSVTLEETGQTFTGPFRKRDK